MKRYKLLLMSVFFSVNYVNGQCACCAGAATGSSGSFNSNNNGKLTLQKKQFIIENYTEYRNINLKSHSIENQEKHEEEETPLKSIFVNSLGARYGITDKLTLSALIPYVFLQTNSGNDNGVGDLMVVSTFNAYSKNNFNLALQGGLELPTGIQKGSNFDNTTVVVGSGSFDPMIGLLISKRWENNITLQGNGTFKFTTNGFKGNYYGNISVQNISISYSIKELQVKGEQISEDSPYEITETKYRWTIFGGYYGEWLDKIREDDIIDQDSGYYLGFLNLGANFSYDQWSFPLTFSSPIIQNVNGQQNDAGVRVRIGIVKSF
ncbi:MULTISPECIES: transporter [unclassified Flavobacterium]|uniref:transporter n=1 Tax=unclassified Flavobacterium TaxID=196869 RepID=UPI000EB326CB|nr:MULTISPECIES: transporter [unclassified Flavobacterium]RKS01668.1 hypothetical protein C8C84_1345 [Flavobacterium sp. 102]